MKNHNKCPFEMAEIEIFALCEYDVIVTSRPGSTGPDPFEGEEDEF